MPSDPSAAPPQLACVAALASEAASLGTADGAAPYVPVLQAAQAFLAEVPDAQQRAGYVEAIARSIPAAGPGRVLFLSFLFAVTRDAGYLTAIDATLSKRPFTLQERYFFYWQLVTRHGEQPGGPDAAALYKSLLQEARSLPGVGGRWIPPRHRDPNAVIVLTTQLLGPQHAPTAECIDYCLMLQDLGKTVLLVNTAVMPWARPLPYYDAVRFNYLDSYSRVGKLNINERSIDFYQCRQPMPNAAEAAAIVRTVRERRPALVISMGHSNLAADLCAQVVTVATMAFVAQVARARSSLYLLPRPLGDGDRDHMRRWEIDPGQVVEIAATFRLPPRTKTFARRDLGLPEDAYVIAIVGNRLDDEITDTAAAELKRLLEQLPEAFVAFAGTFPGYARFTERDPIFAARTAFLGFQNDMLAVYDCCNAYWNPPRYGGGSSAAYALASGVPVLTLDGGDVALAAGRRFVFPSFDAMRAFVVRNARDAEHRRTWQAAARDRFSEMSDREGMMQRLLQDVAAKAEVRARP